VRSRSSTAKDEFEIQLKKAMEDRGDGADVARGGRRRRGKRGGLGCRAEALPDMVEKDMARPPEADGGGNKQYAAAGGPTEAAPTGSDTSGGVDRV
jgi:hypothetical protein